MGWKLFGYYRYWFYWTLACLPMGFIGYYINKRNYLSILIVLPMFIELILLGIEYINSAIQTFTHHLLSGISCFAIIIVVTLCLFDKLKYKLITFGLCIIAIILILVLGMNKANLKFETYRILDSNEYALSGEVYVTGFAGTDEVYVEVIKGEKTYSVKLTGYIGAEYEFTITDENDNEYSFEYHYDEEGKTVLLKEN